jgi:hypothetical protein
VTASPLHDQADSARRSRTRRLALLLALAATGVYAGFIALQVLRARG